MVIKSKDKKAVEEICAGLPDSKKSEDKKIVAKEKAIKSIKKSLPPVPKKAIPVEVVFERPPLPEFQEIKIVSVGYKFNIIGIMRKLNSIGKHFKIIGTSEKEKEIYRNVYKKFLLLFKKKEPVKIEKPVIPEIKTIPKSEKDYSNYYEVNDEEIG
jgi:hypothetical protein